MSVLRTIHCDVCKKTETEPSTGAGWQGWGCIKGVALNGVAEPNLCPSCIHKTMCFVDAMASEHLEEKGNGLD